MLEQSWNDDITESVMIREYSPNYAPAPCVEDI